MSSSVVPVIADQQVTKHITYHPGLPMWKNIREQLKFDPIDTARAVVTTAEDGPLCTLAVCDVSITGDEVTFVIHTDSGLQRGRASCVRHTGEIYL